jgi:nucleotide-binding universal stress UspA family protein
MGSCSIDRRSLGLRSKPHSAGVDRRLSELVDEPPGPTPHCLDAGLSDTRSVVLQHDDDLVGDERIASKPERLIAYLARHGVGRVRIVPVSGDDVASSLLAGAREGNCDVLIAGAYGRLRLNELVLGGTTHSLVNAEGGPHILLAH